MANHKATKKDTLQSLKRRDRNRYYGKTTRNTMRNLLKITEKEEAQGELPKVISMIDKLAKRGVIHKNKAEQLEIKLAEENRRFSLIFFWVSVIISDSNLLPKVAILLFFRGLFLIAFPG